MAPKKLHVNYTNTMDSTAGKVMVKLLPQGILKKMMLSMTAPKSRPLDVYEALKEDTTTIVEIEENKVWLVTHTRGGEQPKDFKSLGYTPVQKNYDKMMEAAKPLGENIVKQLEKDWSTVKDYIAIDPKEGVKGEYCKAWKQDSIMVVVKLHSGNLLLYNPVPIHSGTKLDDWMKTMGEVKYVVIGSCYHTLFLPETLKRYPEAAYIGTKLSEDKLKAANALTKPKLDYDFLVESDVISANEALAKEGGVTLKFTKGDMMTQCIFLLAYGTGVEVDLLYGHHSECPCDYCKAKGIFKGYDTDPAYFWLRLFNIRLMAKPNSPFGYLPPYRFAGMDPTSVMSKMTWPRPANDGSSCKELATSLREILKMDYKNVISIHWGLVAAKDFKLSINEDWKWLDEASLLPE